MPPNESKSKFVRRYYSMAFQMPLGWAQPMTIPNYVGYLEEIVLQVRGVLTLPQRTAFRGSFEDEETEVRQSIPADFLRRITLKANMTMTMLDITGAMAHYLAYLRPETVKLLPLSAPTKRGRNLWRVPYHFRFDAQLMGNAYVPIELGNMAVWQMTAESISSFDEILDNARGAEWSNGVLVMHLLSVHTP